MKQTLAWLEDINQDDVPKDNTAAVHQCEGRPFLTHSGIICDVFNFISCRHIVGEIDVWSWEYSSSVMDKIVRCADSPWWSFPGRFLHHRMSSWCSTMFICEHTLYIWDDSVGKFPLKRRCMERQMSVPCIPVTPASLRLLADRWVAQWEAKMRGKGFAPGSTAQHVAGHGCKKTGCTVLPCGDTKYVNQ
jgi:hypothetical protein